MPLLARLGDPRLTPDLLARLAKHAITTGARASIAPALISFQLKI